MTFRVIAWCVFLAGAAVLGGGLSLIGELPLQPPAARHLREMKRRTEVPLDVASTSQAAFLALPHRTTLAERAAIEAHAVSLEGWTQTIILAGDGDVHLELTASPKPLGAFGSPYVTAEITPPWRTDSPGWAYDRLVEALRPNKGGRDGWVGGTTHVRITGWLLYDYPYDGIPSAWALEHAGPRVSGWEIHPVTRIERWDDARACWSEVER